MYWDILTMTILTVNTAAVAAVFLISTNPALGKPTNNPRWPTAKPSPQAT